MALFTKDNEISQLKKELADARKKLTGLTILQMDNRHLRKQNEDLKIKMQEYEEQIEQLTSKLSVLENPAHNERGAGRKSKATEENVSEILRLRDEGLSYSQIAGILTENNGEYISKSTVAKIVANFS